MKRIFTGLFAVIIIFQLASCGSDNKPNDDVKDAAKRIMTDLGVTLPEVTAPSTKGAAQTKDAVPTKDGAQTKDGTPSKDGASTKKSEVIQPSQLVSRDDAARILGVSMPGSENDAIDVGGSAGHLKCEYMADEYTFRIDIAQDAMLSEDVLKFLGDTYFLFHKDTAVYYEMDSMKENVFKVEGLGDEAYIMNLFDSMGAWHIEIYKNGYWIGITIQNTDTVFMLSGDTAKEIKWQKEKLTELGELALERLAAL